MNLRCLRTFLLGGVLAGALTFLGAPAAHAVGESPTVDGDLTDLIAAVNANLGSDKGGFAFVDPASDVFTGTCAYVNGYDIVKSYAYFRLKDGSGAYVPNNVTLYLGWEVTGNIGDVDGDGNADTFDSGGPGTGCALSDGGGNTGCASGIGVGESYSILLNLNCSGADDLRLGVSNNKVGILTAGGDLQTEIVGGVFCRNGHFLELSIPHYETLLQAPALQAIGATLCQANLRMVANAGDDLLAEDTTPVQQLRIPGSITITKTPTPQDACPGSEISWSIEVCNNGICPFSTVTVTDTLDAGLTYKGDDQGSSQGPNAQIRVWTFSNLNPGACKTDLLIATVDAPCAAAVLNNNVGVEAVEPASPCSQLAEAATAHANAKVNCAQPSVGIDKHVGTPSISPGQTTLITLTISNPGGTALHAVSVCDKLDAGVSFDAAQAIGGTCATLLFSNTLNGDGTRTICFNPFDLAKGASCTITYLVGCETSGTHPDTATVVAYCPGDDDQKFPVTARDQDSFLCQGGGSCPRTVGYWAAQCAQKQNGSTKFSKNNVNKIAECVDGKVQIFSWPGGGFNAFDGFCAIITPDKPMNCKKQALRQFAGLLANACVGELKFLASNGDSVFLNLSDPSPCKDFGPTLGDLINGIDQALVQLKNENADPQDPRYCAIVECADGINNGRTIRVAPGCSEGTGTSGLNRGTTGGDLGLDSFDAGSVQPGKVELYKPIPNPFANSTEIAYAVGGSGQDVQIGIYDVAGRLVRSLVHEFRAPGQYQVSWNGQDEGGRSVVHGVYFLRAYVGGQRMAAGSSRILYLR